MEFFAENHVGSCLFSVDDGGVPATVASYIGEMHLTSSFIDTRIISGPAIVKWCCNSDFYSIANAIISRVARLCLHFKLHNDCNCDYVTHTDTPLATCLTVC